MNTERLLFLMDEIGVSLRTLDEKSGVFYSTLSRIMSNQSQLKYENVVKLCMFFNVSADFLLNLDDYGYIVYCDDIKIVLSYDEAIKYKEYIKISEKNYENKSHELQPNTYIRREFIASTIKDKLALIERLKDDTKSMEFYQIANTLDFVEKYILK